MTEGNLQRLILDYRNGEIVLRCLYRTQSLSNPGTKARAREASSLARSGLQDALKALDGDVECVGTSGFTTREDVLLAATSPAADNLAEGACF
jgi:hypothetical protein